MKHFLVLSMWKIVVLLNIWGESVIYIFLQDCLMNRKVQN